MRLNIGTKIVSGFAVILALFIVLGIVVVLNVNNMNRQFEFVVEHDAPLIANAYELKKLVVDMETGVRGFIITQNDEFLEPYDKGISEFAALMATEKELDSNNPSQVSALERIETLVSRWQQEAARPQIAMARQIAQGKAEFEHVVALVEAGKGKNLLEQIRREFDQFVQVEAYLTAERQANAAAAASTTRNMTIILTIFSIVFGGAVAMFIARSITKPIGKLVRASEIVAQRDLTPEIEVKSKGEIGQLSGSFKTMLSNIRMVIAEIQGAGNVLASAINQMMTATTQIASSVNETATTVSEATTTAEETRQTAEVANEKAQLVSEAGQKAVQSAEAGNKSAAEAMENLNNIREQMGTVSETILRLSEQSLAVGEITTTVNLIADQSNLLAVNAAIEAAKAGEAGKGFGVVAQEVKNLAAQSRQATVEVRQILTDIQKGVSAAVMATEQGTKAVDAGIQQGSITTGAIEALAATIGESAQAGVQIGVSSKQQITGMEQIVTAMENIKEASVQNAASAKQLQKGSEDLQELGQKLNQVVGQFKI